jgi:hypothetical protein
VITRQGSTRFSGVRSKRQSTGISKLAIPSGSRIKPSGGNSDWKSVRNEILYLHNEVSGLQLVYERCQDFMDPFAYWRNICGDA